MESVEIELDTYTADTIAAHKKIRQVTVVSYTISFSPSLQRPRHFLLESCFVLKRLQNALNVNVNGILLQFIISTNITLGPQLRNPVIV